VVSFSRPEERRETGPMTLDEIEKQHIIRVLESTGQNRTRAARILGIGLRTLQRKLKSYDDRQTTSE